MATTTTKKTAKKRTARKTVGSAASRGAKSTKKTGGTGGKKTGGTGGKKTAKKKDGLRKPQVRILSALSASKKALSRQQIAVKAPVDAAACVEYIGSHDPVKREANDKKHFPSLISLGLVKAEQHDVEGRDTVVYSITAKGKTAVKNA